MKNLNNKQVAQMCVLFLMSGACLGFIAAGLLVGDPCQGDTVIQVKPEPTPIVTPGWVYNMERLADRVYRDDLEQAKKDWPRGGKANYYESFTIEYREGHTKKSGGHYIAGLIVDHHIILDGIEVSIVDRDNKIIRIRLDDLRKIRNE